MERQARQVKTDCAYAPRQVSWRDLPGQRPGLLVQTALRAGSPEEGEILIVSTEGNGTTYP